MHRSTRPPLLPPALTGMIRRIARALWLFLLSLLLTWLMLFLFIWAALEPPL